MASERINQIAQETDAQKGSGGRMGKKTLEV
jgi:hypothetical protein